MKGGRRILYSVPPRHSFGEALERNLGAPPRVWVIVLMYGAEELTTACLESLRKQDHGALTVLLVNNASPDGAGERVRARFPGIEYLDTGANLGYTGGNNRGIEYALRNGADYVLVLNNDTELDPRCVSLLVETAKSQERVGAVSPKILYYDDRSRIWYGGGDFSWRKAIGDHRRQMELDGTAAEEAVERMTFATGCAFLMPAAVAREMKGFREDFFIYCEDVELSVRLHLAGYRMYYQPNARLYHHEPLAPDPSPFQIRLRDRNRRRMVRQHFALAARLQFAAWFYPTRVARMAQYLVKRDWARARAIIAGATER